MQAENNKYYEQCCWFGVFWGFFEVFFGNNIELILKISLTNWFKGETLN